MINNWLENKSVRSCYDEGIVIWYFRVIDMKEILTDSNVPKRLWSDLKNKLAEECGKVYGKIIHFKMEATDGSKPK